MRVSLGWEPDQAAPLPQWASGHRIVLASLLSTVPEGPSPGSENRTGLNPHVSNDDPAEVPDPYTARSPARSGVLLRGGEGSPAHPANLLLTNGLALAETGQNAATVQSGCKPGIAGVGRQASTGQEGVSGCSSPPGPTFCGVSRHRRPCLAWLRTVASARSRLAVANGHDRVAALRHLRIMGGQHDRGTPLA